MDGLKAWAFVAVPVVAVLELAAHVVQTRSVVPDADWTAAKTIVQRSAHPDDLVVFAPRWTDPVGRLDFGAQMATVEREAYADVTRFPRAFEVSIRGEHVKDLAGWKKVGEEHAGKVTVTTFENPSWTKTVDDLLAHVSPTAMEVTVGDAGRACPWMHTQAQTGNLGFGPAIPADRFACGRTFAGISVIADLDYRAHRCLYAPPPGGPEPLRVTFKDVTFGDVLHGHHGLYVEAERNEDGAPISLAFSVGGKVLGRVSHADGQGWKEFELPTGELKGQRGDLVAEVSAANGHRRMYCFEAITR